MNCLKLKSLPRLQAALTERGFIGPLGIDAFIYRTPEGELKLKPVVEINPRVTMGRIAHELGIHNGPGCVGYFQILTKSQLRKLGHSAFDTYTEELQKLHPVKLTGESKARIESGSFPLNDPSKASQFLALYHVRKNMTSLSESGLM